VNSSKVRSLDSLSTVSRRARLRCIQAWITRQRFCGSFRASPRPQALAAASNVTTNSVINCQEQQSLTEYHVALYLLRASDGSGQKRFSKAVQKRSTPGLPKYLVCKTLSSWLFY